MPTRKKSTRKEQAEAVAKQDLRNRLKDILQGAMGQADLKTEYVDADIDSLTMLLGLEELGRFICAVRHTFALAPSGVFEPYRLGAWETIDGIVDMLYDADVHA